MPRTYGKQKVGCSGKEGTEAVESVCTGMTTANVQVKQKGVICNGTVTAETCAGIITAHPVCLHREGTLEPVAGAVSPNERGRVHVSKRAARAASAPDFGDRLSSFICSIASKSLPLSQCAQSLIARFASHPSTELTRL